MTAFDARCARSACKKIAVKSRRHSPWAMALLRIRPASRKLAVCPLNQKNTPMRKTHARLPQSKEISGRMIFCCHGQRKFSF